VAQVFFSSGQPKLRDWDITLALFADEDHVPLLRAAGYWTLAAQSLGWPALRTGLAAKLHVK
jgi:putative oxidoreductase